MGHHDVVHGVPGARLQVEARLCLGRSTDITNIGITHLSLETSMDGITFQSLYAMTAASPSACLSPWEYDSTANACVAPDTDGADCHTLVFHPQAPYRFIRGTANAVQFGDACAFGPTGRTRRLEGTSHRCLAFIRHAIEMSLQSYSVASSPWLTCLNVVSSHEMSPWREES